jgi:hypothetical protein
MIVFIPYVTELMLMSGFDWDSLNHTDIKFSRKFLKSLYMTFRIICYFVFLFRVLVIYTNWKLRKQAKGFFTIFKSEDKVVIVSKPF